MLSATFPPFAARQLPPDLAQASETDKGHGRIERRTLETSVEVVSHLDWPGLAQVCRIERRRWLRDKESVEVVYAITSLSRPRVRPEQLLTLARAHWGIENRLHLVRDVTLREDACRVRSGSAPQALAALRNLVLTLTRRLGYKPVEGREHFAEHRAQAIRLIRNGIL